MTIKRFDSESAKQVVTEIRESLAALAAAHGLNLRLDRASFSAGMLSVTVNLGVIDVDGQVVTPEVDEFRLRAGALGLRPEDLGKTFRCGKEELVVLGMVPRARKNPLLIRRNLDGTVFRVSAEYILRHLKGDPCRHAPGHDEHGAEGAADEST